MVTVRNMRVGEELPAKLLETGTPYLDPDWVWVVCPKDSDTPFAILVASFAHGWLVLWRIIATDAALPNWFLEALPQVFDNAKKRGCLGILTMLADGNEAEVKMARIIAASGGTLVPFVGSIAAAPIV